MSLEAFETFRFHAKTLKIIDDANAIISEYRERGFVLTLRQLYYQFVARALIENSFAEYKKLGTVIKNGRRAGLIDWDAIEDRTRNVRSDPVWESPADIIAQGVSSIKRISGPAKISGSSAGSKRTRLSALLRACAKTGDCLTSRVAATTPKANNTRPASASRPTLQTASRRSCFISATTTPTGST